MPKLWNPSTLTRGQTRSLLGILIACLTCYSTSVQAAGTKASAKTAKTTTTTIYKYLDSEGVLHLSNKPPQKSEEVLYSRSYVVQPYTPPPLPTLSQLPAFKIFPPDGQSPTLPKINAKLPARASEYAELINNTATRYGLPAALLHAVVKVESGYNPSATSPKGAVGLMQLMPGTAKRYGVTDRADPIANLDGGARYLRDLLGMFNQNMSLALAGYNAGENAVIRYGNTIPPYRETQNYVTQVMAIYRSHLLNATNFNYPQLAEK